MSATFTLSFEPIDVLLFRDHRPFDAGLHAEARRRMPLPSVFRGALRTALLRDAGVDFSPRSWEQFHQHPMHVWLGDPGDKNRPADPGTLQLRGPVLARGLSGTTSHQPSLEPLYPAPADLRFHGADGKDEKGWSGRLPLSNAFLPGKILVTGIHGAPPEALPWNDGADAKAAEPRDQLVDAGTALDWLSRPWGQASEPRDTISRDEVCVVEARTGIARDLGLRTVSEAMLYNLELWRFDAGAGFAVEVEAPGDAEVKALQALDRRALPLGGKGHQARVRVLDGALITGKFQPPPGGGVRVLLIAPLALGASGLVLPEEKARLRTLVRPGSPPAPAGGFDMAHGQPKPLHATLPAGTILEIDDLTNPQLIGQHNWGQSDEHARAGHGAAIFGGYNP